MFPKQRGNIKVSNLDVINALLYILEQGCKWRALPTRFGRWHTIYMRFSRWAKSGILQKAFKRLAQEKLCELSVLGLDSTPLRSIQTDVVLVLNNVELVDRSELVVRRIGEVHHPNLRPFESAIFPVLDVDPIHQHPMERPVTRSERRSLWRGQPVECVVQGFGQKIRIQPDQGTQQGLLQEHLRRTCPQRIGSQHRVGPANHLVAQLLNQPSAASSTVDSENAISSEEVARIVGMTGHLAGSASRLATRRIIRSLRRGSLSAMSRVSAVSAWGLRRWSTPSCLR